MPDIKRLIISLDYDGLRKLLNQDPSLANEGIPLDEHNCSPAHPLHRICDGIFHGLYSDEEGREIARIFIEHGANVDGVTLIENKDSPLIAAASLHAEQTGIFYIDKGANIFHPGTHGGTALHWAAWTGRDKLVDKLIRAGADIHRHCVDFDNTPLQWAIHGYKSSGEKNRHHQAQCAQLLIDAGAEKVDSLSDILP